MTTAVGSPASVAELSRDPYPIYRQLRDTGACVYLAAAGRYVIPRWKDVFELDLNPAVTAREDDSLMTRAMGLNMLRTDGETHARLRGSCQGVLRGKTFVPTWHDRFTAIADELIDGLQARGRGDLLAEFAAPFATRTLKLLLGIADVDDRDLDFASRAFIDAIDNYEDDPQVWARCERANSLIDEAVQRWSPHAEPGTVLRSMIDAGLTAEEISAHVKLFVSGPINEPRDVIASTVWAVLRDPVQTGLVRNDPSLLSAAMEETLRWLSPIGMNPRRVQQDTVVGGVELPAGTPLGVLVASANRDERRWENPDDFDLRRASQGHVAFGRGAYVCVGAFVARRTIGAIALPRIFGRLPDLALADRFTPQLRGWVFRGLNRLDVTWSAR